MDRSPQRSVCASWLKIELRDMLPGKSAVTMSFPNHPAAVTHGSGAIGLRHHILPPSGHLPVPNRATLVLRRRIVKMTSANLSKWLLFQVVNVYTLKEHLY